MFDECDPFVNKKAWDLKVDKKNEIQLWCNNKGTSVCKDFTAWRGRIWFNKGFKIDRVVKAVSIIITNVSIVCGW